MNRYNITCHHCRKDFEGRYWHAGWNDGPLRYCTQCSRLRLGQRNEPPGPHACMCGGTFDSLDLKCPACGKIIEDAEDQLAAQVYAIDTAADPDHPTPEEIGVFLRDRLGLAGRTLFVQLGELLAPKGMKG